jgi:opacity protein-like surface antigen
VFDFSGSFSNPTFGAGDLSQFGPVLGITPFQALFNTSTFTYLFGPRLSYRTHRFERFTPFAEALVGAATFRFSSAEVSITKIQSNTSFATALGGGIDFRMYRRVTVRLFDVDYLLTRFPVIDVNTVTLLPEFSGIRRTQNNIRASVGVVFNIGRKE